MTISADCKCAHCGHVASRRLNDDWFELGIDVAMTCNKCGKKSILVPTLQGPDDFPFVLTRPEGE